MACSGVSLMRPTGPSPPARNRTSDDYLQTGAAKLAVKISEKAQQARQRSWSTRTALLIDISAARDLAQWLDGVAIAWEEHFGGPVLILAVPVGLGLLPSWAKDVKIGARLINARSETLTEKPAFRAAAARRRCLVPATGYFAYPTRW
jgi:hypothetical protein